MATEEELTQLRQDLTDRANSLEQNIEVCFHLAAQVEVGVASYYPNLTWENNIRGTYNLLEAIREQGKHVKSVIIASSDKAYGSYPKNKMPYKESYELRPKFPYDVSKACTELIARSYTSELYNLPIVITRFTNIYGPGQVNFSALIPDCIQTVLGHGKFIPRGNGENVRDFLYVKDVVDVMNNIDGIFGYIAAMADGKLTTTNRPGKGWKIK